ncbi:hypothetical protein CRP01_38190 [Flavilitoribacter nigricans DSM 23189 = NBRC 102662]|uniref:Uncharacterized protein n=2 Tax=Flavilitoribacter TaxID=2762562 RepID=A0A2D0MY80_FLAN2|nr:hypothetical protein CRP01_38190 [Flavilitoribacter nigricans DSM 23189 = NBRC 102662]
MLILTMLALAFSSTAPAQSGGSSNIPNLRELPVTLSWDDSGIRIVAKTSNPRSGNILSLVPSRFLEQIGNDLIRVTPGSGQAPVIIDLTDYFRGTSGATADATNMIDNTVPQVTIEMPKLTLSSYNEPNSFLVEIQNYSNREKGLSQTFLFRGLDIFYVNSSECVKRSSESNRIILDVSKCETVKYLVIEGGLLNLADVDEKIPALCEKYNDRYYTPGQTKAFLCVEECMSEGAGAYEHLKHVRELITKYNITDYEDAPLSYIGDVILTRKGVGLNLKKKQDAKLFKKKEDEFAADHAYKFFPWYEFINLNFDKYEDDQKLIISDPNNNNYLYDSRVYFSNVELIQFFSELKDLISDRVK